MTPAVVSPPRWVKGLVAEQQEDCREVSGSAGAVDGEGDQGRAAMLADREAGENQSEGSDDHAEAVHDDQENVEDGLLEEERVDDAEGRDRPEPDAVRAELLWGERRGELARRGDHPLTVGDDAGVGCDPERRPGCPRRASRSGSPWDARRPYDLQIWGARILLACPSSRARTAPPRALRSTPPTPAGGTGQTGVGELLAFCGFCEYREFRPDLAPRRAKTSYDRRRVAPLICIECGDYEQNGEGWKGELAVDLLDEEEPDEVAVYCPDCWEREFNGV